MPIQLGIVCGSFHTAELAGCNRDYMDWIQNLSSDLLYKKLADPYAVSIQLSLLDPEVTY